MYLMNKIEDLQPGYAALTGRLADRFADCEWLARSSDT
jgi:hypothetical protein